MTDRDISKKDEAADENARKNQTPSPGEVQSALHGASYEAEDVFENAEPWDPVETKIVVGSFLAALIFLIVFGYLINIFILH